MRIIPFLLLVAACARPAKSPIQRFEAAIVTAKGAPSSLERLLSAAANSSAICVGEQHDEAQHHRFQHLLFRHLIGARESRPLALGLEMMQRPLQPVLDDYAAGRLDEAGLFRLSAWDQRWGFDFAMYRPLFEDAHDYGVALRALNAPRELTKMVARRGLDGLDEATRAWLPTSLDLDDSAHRRFFWAAMGFGPQGGHGGTEPEHLYAAQVVWDETMAQEASQIMAAGAQILILAGNGHCHESAIPARIERRMPESSTLSVLLKSEHGELMAHTTSDFVVTLPSP